MNLDLCDGESLRLCNSCRRNVSNQTIVRGLDVRPRLTPTTHGERCHNWYPRPPQPIGASK